MKHLQIFSKYLIYLSIVGVPVLWFGLQKADLLGFDFFGTSPYQLFFDLSLVAAFFVMIIRPLSDIFPQYKILKRLVFFRKSLGIFSAMIIVTVMISNWIQNPDASFFRYFHSDKWQLGYPVIARVSEITAVVLLATSNIWSVVKLKKNWKRIQRLAYPYFFSGAIIAARWEHTNIIYTMIGIVIVLWLVAEIMKWENKRAS